jgi:hypothetical protein
MGLSRVGPHQEDTQGQKQDCASQVLILETLNSELSTWKKFFKV